jgi:hypothetical protein
MPSDAAQCCSFTNFVREEYWLTCDAAMQHTPGVACCRTAGKVKRSWTPHVNTKKL